MKKKILIISGITAGVILIAVISFVIRYNMMKGRISAYVVENVDLNKVPDGTYQGQAGDFLAAVTLKVTVKEGKIDKIDIVKQDCGPGYDALDTIDRIIEAQSPKVDTTSGATGSSLCIQAAVYRALSGAGSAEEKSEEKKEKGENIPAVTQ